MGRRIDTPSFANEAEEARWWFENQDLIDAEFELAAKEGRLGHGTVARRAKEAEMAMALVGLDPEDVKRARAQAERRGMDYQAYVKMVMHRALLMEEQSA
jgi:predicted DNA binding CopG/RHH family protein